MFHDINFSLSSVGALLLFYIEEQEGGTSQRIDRANAARGGMVGARSWAFHAVARRRGPPFSNSCAPKGATSPNIQEHTRRYNENKARTAAPSPPNGMLSVSDTQERLTTDHTRRHTTRSPLAHAESFAHKNNTAPTNEGIRRGGVESFGAQCTQKIGKVRTQSR